MPADGTIALRPASIGVTEAAALGCVGLTALVGDDGTAPAAGETVLVLGAGGAVGGYSVQLAAARGASVIATAKAVDEARVRGLGAAETIDYRTVDLAEFVSDRHPGGIDVLIDLVNDREVLLGFAELVRDGGRVASARFAADASVLGARGIDVTNISARDCVQEELVRLVELVADARLQIALDGVRPLDEVGAAVSEFAGGGRGKIGIAVRG